MTVTDKDLFLAILAMDSYNRGYGAVLNDGGRNDNNGLGGVGSQIGTETITQQSDTEPDSAGVDAGFYAVAYTTQYVTVISYRGTDNFFGPGSSGGDIWNGWVFGTGAPTGQLALARQFYEAVTGTSSFSNAGNAFLAGHSPGGGLAASVGCAPAHRTGRATSAPPLRQDHKGQTHLHHPSVESTTPCAP